MTSPPHPGALAEGPRRARSGSVERPIDGRLYRKAWLVLLFPLLLGAFTVGRPAPLPREVTSLQPAFDGTEAAALARELAGLYPDRSPGSPASPGAARWVREQLELLFELPIENDAFFGEIPGRGRVELENIAAVAAGQSRDTIVVVAHRDSTSGRASSVDNASGTAALIELARGYAANRSGTGGGVSPRHTLLFLSTDAGAYGLLGARRFARSSPHAERVVAVVNLDGIGSSGRPRVELAGHGPHSPAPALVATAAARIREEARREPARPSVLGQLVDFAFPFSLHEQDSFLSREIPALTITSEARSGGSGELDEIRLGQLGRAAEATIASVDARLELALGTSSYIYAGDRTIPGWALALLLVAMTLPFAVTLVDLVARLRRKAIPLRPALRSYARRLGFWLWAGAAFSAFGLLGVWPDGAPAPLNPDSEAAGHWPRFGLTGLALLMLGGWLVARVRLARRGAVSPEEELAGYAAVLSVLALVMLVTIITNPYALLFVLPSAHAWLWLPQTREQRRGLRALLFAAGLTGPLLLLVSFGVRFGLGLDAPWYLAELTAIGYVPVVDILLFLAWIAVAAQVFAVTAGRYAPYPAAAERPRRGTVGEVVAALRARR